MMEKLKNILIELIDEYKSFGSNMESGDSNENEVVSNKSSSSDFTGQRVRLLLVQRCMII